MTKCLVVLLASTLAASPLTLAADSGSLAGRVLTPAGGTTPTAVWAASATSPNAPQRAAVGAKGSFVLESLPAGPVELAVETEQGLYVVETPVTIAPGATRQVQLALRGRQHTGKAADGTSAAPPPGGKKSGNIWDNPLTATLIVIGGAVVTGLIIDAVNDNDASPSNP